MKLTNENYVGEAERVIRSLIDENNRKILTTSKIRNILSMITDIYNDVRELPGTELDPELLGRIQYLKVHIVYEAGRETTVRNFVEKADLLRVLDSIGNSKERFLLFCHYMEALVAYRKYLGQNDK